MRALIVAALLVSVLPAVPAHALISGSDVGQGGGHMLFGQQSDAGWDNADECTDYGWPSWTPGTGFDVGDGIPRNGQDQDRFFRLSSLPIMTRAGIGAWLKLCGSVRGSCAGGIEGFDGYGRLEHMNTGEHYQFANIAWPRSASGYWSPLLITGRYEKFDASGSDTVIETGQVLIEMTQRSHHCFGFLDGDWDHSEVTYSIQLIAD